MRAEAEVEPCMERYLAVEVREAGATERMAQTIQEPLGRSTPGVAEVEVRVVARAARAEPAARV